MTTRVTIQQIKDKIDFINSRMTKKELVLMQSYGYNHIGIRYKGAGPGAGIDRQLEGGMTKRECLNWLRAFHYGRWEDN